MSTRAAEFATGHFNVDKVKSTTVHDHFSVRTPLNPSSHYSDKEILDACHSAHPNAWHWGGVVRREGNDPHTVTAFINKD